MGLTIPYSSRDARSVRHGRALLSLPTTGVDTRFARNVEGGVMPVDSGNDFPQPRAQGRDRGTRCGSFIVDRRGTILGFDLEMEALTGWPAIDVVGHNKELSEALATDERGELRSTALPLYGGTIPMPADSQRLELRLNCRDGRSIDVEAVVIRLPGSGDRLAVSVHRVLARSASQPATGDIHQSDPLTGLSSRAVFTRRVATYLRSAAAIGRPLALVFADVDHLRRINDRVGHAAGSEVLRRIAGILRASVPDEDLVSRLGDDDFAMLLLGAGRGEARQVAARLRSTVERFRFFGTRDEENPVQVTLSLGAASYPADADNEADLMERAREALEEARSFGRNRVWCYLRRPRVPVQVPVYFDGAESMLVGFTLDLSPSGLFVQTRTPVEIGMRCALAFPLPGTEDNVHVIGRVVRTVPAQQAMLADARVPGMGIEFEKLGPADRRTLEMFLHLHESSTLRPEDGTFSF